MRTHQRWNGVANSDWYITCGGDGFESQADYEDANIVLCSITIRWFDRFDKKARANRYQAHRI